VADAAVWTRLLEQARWAPSPHNIQPWRVRPRSATAADLLYDPARLLPDTDPTGFFTQVGFGIFLEALDVAAAAHGLEVEVAPVAWRLDATAAGLPLLARLRLAPRTRPEPLDASLLERRRTSRLRYDGEPVDAATLEACRAIAAAAGQSWTATSDPEAVAWTLRLNRDTLFYDMADAAARGEVGRWIRTTPAEERRHRDGLSARCLGFPGWLLRLFFRHHRLMEWPGLRQAIRMRYDRSMRGTRTVAWLTGRFDGPADAVAAGRMLGRLWLTLTARGVGLHPFGSIITNPRAYARLRERMAGGDPQARTWLIMRLGRSAEPPRSLRREAAEVLA
jgi:hypothetical protein